MARTLKPDRTKRRKPADQRGERTPVRGKNAGDAEWDRAARWYDALVGAQGSDYQQSLILPGALRLLEPEKSFRLLDLACGQGVFCRYLAGRGYRVEGLDISSALVASAKKRSPASIAFHVADAADPQALKGKAFDGIACLLAVQNMERLLPVFQNVKRWLKPGGRFVLIMTHPCFRIPRQSHWGYDEDKKTQFRRVDLYASETEIPILTPPKKGARGFTTTYHRPLQSYFNALAEAGLAVDCLEEWASEKTSEPGKRAKAENRARREFPLFLALRAGRLPDKQ